MVYAEIFVAVKCGAERCGAGRFQTFEAYMIFYIYYVVLVDFILYCLYHAVNLQTIMNFWVNSEKLVEDFVSFF